MGGPARYFAEATDERSVREALEWARSRGVRVVMLGGGSNVLVADSGVDSLVLRAAIRGVTMEPSGDVVHVTAGAGERWDDLASRAVQSGLAGIECLSGIPGDVGAAPIQNIGAYGQEVSQTIVRVRALARRTGEVAEIDAPSCQFGYRDSAFKRDAKDLYVITSVTFALRPGGAPLVRYAELERKLGETAGAAPSIDAVRAAVLELRRSKSMLLDPGDENVRSAGSFFMNPTLDEAAFDAVKRRIDASGVVGEGEVMPSYPAGGGRMKLSAAWLIERAGLRKGAGDGRVGLSTRHTLAIVNRGGATAAEIVAFALRVRGVVLDRFGVALVPEPVFLGFSPGELGPFAESLPITPAEM